ncbi:Fc receptor-like protein 3 [Melospiza melodia melodia]|uniref:Fc receptor-like protein 3 n=1 Tax=Melospiza melodia melodia TaxID=1914991 RepID=UPI002FD2B8BB
MASTHITDLAVGVVPPLESYMLHHSSRYGCMGLMRFFMSRPLRLRAPLLHVFYRDGQVGDEGEVLYTHVMVTKRRGDECSDHPDSRGAPLEAEGAVGRGDTDLPGLGDRQCHHLERWPQQRVTASAHGWGHRDGREVQTLDLAGAQTTQLLVEPPWRPAVVWDRVTLTCQGSGTAGATTWYKDSQRWWQKGQERLSVTETGAYTCDRPGTGRSPPVTVLDDQLVLQVTAQALLEGDTLTLHCRCRQENHLTRVRFYREEKDFGMSLKGTKLSLSPLQLQNSGRYRCEGLVGSWQSRSAPVTVTVHELFSVPELEGPRELTEGSPLTLSCLSTPSPLRPRAPLLYVFYQDGQVVGGPQESPQVLVPAVRVSHSGHYGCEVHSQGGSVRKSSNRLRITVCRVPPSGVSLSAQPPGGQVALGDSLVLSCAVAIGTGPLSFYWNREGSGALLGTGPHLELRHIGDNDSGQYRCRVSDGNSVAESDPLNVTVLVPVANATISHRPLTHQVRAGDNVTLRCSVQVGSAPVTFTWLHNGQEVAQGPLLELRDIDAGHSGTYQCVATNQLGQDGHRVFRALSPELALEVTPGSPWVTVATGVGGALFFLLLLVVVIVTWHRPPGRTRKEEGEVLYTHVMITKWAGGCHKGPVTLTCQASGTIDDTIWYKDGQRSGQEGHDHFTAHVKSTYVCDRPSTSPQEDRWHSGTTKC